MESASDRESSRALATEPGRVWRAGLVLGLAFGILPLVQGLHQAREWWQERAGLDERGQLLSYRVQWTNPALFEMAARIDALLPPDAPLIMTPDGGEDISGRSRWFLYLANELYPRKVYVRRPHLASSTLVEYPVWLRFHFEQIDTDGSGQRLAMAAKATNIRMRMADEFAAVGAEWELFYKADLADPFSSARLEHRGRPVDLATGEVLER